MRVTALLTCVGFVVAVYLIALPGIQAATRSHLPQKIHRQMQKQISLTGTLTQIDKGIILVIPSRGKSIKMQIDAQTTIQTRNHKPLSVTNLATGDHLAITFLSQEQLSHFFVQAKHIVDKNK